MAQRNPESVITSYFRRVVEKSGGYFFKISDRFTRGIPDCHVTFTRGVFIELKEGRFDKSIDTYQHLKVSGIQDSRIRNICRRSPDGACVLTAPCESPADMALWVPVRPQKEDSRKFNHYRCAARGEREVMKWLGLKTSQT
jgi:hypothetical protein